MIASSQKICCAKVVWASSQWQSCFKPDLSIFIGFVQKESRCLLVDGPPMLQDCCTRSLYTRVRWAVISVCVSVSLDINWLWILFDMQFRDNFCTNFRNWFSWSSKSIISHHYHLLYFHLACVRYGSSWTSTMIFNILCVRTKNYRLCLCYLQVCEASCLKALRGDELVLDL